MKKSLKIYIWAWVALTSMSIFALVAASIHTSHHDLAENPNNIELITKLDLPEITETQSWNNLDRGASRWDTYIHRSLFSEHLTEEHIKTLDELCQCDSLHWHKDADNECYIYSDEGGIDELYFVDCYIYDNHSVVEYMIDEDEGIFLIFPFILAFNILVLWGIVLAILSIRKKIQRV